MKNDATKLPKWAQDEIISLRRQRDEAREDLKERIESPGSRVSTWNRNGKEVCDRIHVSDQTYRFHLKDEAWVEVGFDNYKRLKVSCGSGYLTIKPEASNHVTVTVTDA